MSLPKNTKICLIVVLIAAFAVVAGCAQSVARSKSDRQIDLAVKHLSEDKFEEAVLAYNEAIKIDPKSVSGYKGLGKAYTIQGKFDDAEKVYQQGQDLVTDKDQLKLCLAGLYIDKNMMDQAQEMYNQIIAADPAYIPAYEGLYRLLLAQGKAYDAIPLLIKCTQSNANNAFGHFLLADAYLRTGDRDNALDALTKSLEADVNQRASFLLVDRLFNMNWNDVVGFGDQAMSKGSSAGRIIKIYGLYKSGEYDRVIDEYSALSAQDPLFNKATVFSALSHLKRNEQKEADSLITKVELDKVKSPTIYADVADYYLERGNADKAQKTALSGLQYNDMDLDVIKTLFDVVSKKNEKEKKYYSYLLYSMDPGPIKLLNEKADEHGISPLKTGVTAGPTGKMGGKKEQKGSEEDSNILTSTVMIIDVSDSMGENWQGGRKIDSAKIAAKQMLSLIGQENTVFGPKHEVSLVSFSEGATLELPTTFDINQAMQTVEGLHTMSSTNIGEALQNAENQLGQVFAEKKIMVLLSDGKSNRGLSNNEILTGPVSQAEEKGYVIYTIGFGDQGGLDENLLTQIAQNTGGNYYYATGGFELQNIYLKLRHQGAGDIIAEYKGDISQGETKEIGKLQVPSRTGQLHSTLNWGGSMLDLTLKDPKGRIVDDKYPGAKIYREKPDYVIVENPIPGEWTAEAYGREVPESREAYDFIASSRKKDATGYKGLAVLGVMLLIGLSVVILVKRLNKRYCSRCGLKMEKGQQFCPECGEKYGKK